MRLRTRGRAGSAEREGIEVDSDVQSCKRGWQGRHSAGETQHGEPHLGSGMPKVREATATPEVTPANGGLPGMPQATDPSGRRVTRRANRPSPPQHLSCDSGIRTGHDSPSPVDFAPLQPRLAGTHIAAASQAQVATGPGPGRTTDTVTCCSEVVGAPLGDVASTLSATDPLTDTATAACTVTVRQAQVPTAPGPVHGTATASCSIVGIALADAFATVAITSDATDARTGPTTAACIVNATAPGSAHVTDTAIDSVVVVDAASAVATIASQSDGPACITDTATLTCDITAAEVASASGGCVGRAVATSDAARHTGAVPGAARGGRHRRPRRPDPAGRRRNTRVQLRCGQTHCLFISTARNFAGGWYCQAHSAVRRKHQAFDSTRGFPGEGPECGASGSDMRSDYCLDLQHC